MAGRARRADDRPLLIVATQCIEAGANFDFDRLVSEAASLDALRQRFGRLDRLGELETSHAVIVAHSGQVGTSAESDPVYGTALRDTWAWLQHVAAGATAPSKAGKGARRKVERSPEVDFGANWLPLPSGSELIGLLTPRSVPPEHAPGEALPVSRAPVLLPAHLDAWVQTHPVPEPDPAVALWLHGSEAGLPDVNLVWRADLEEADLASPERALAIVAACPPSSAEAMPVPLHAVRGWLGGEVVDLTDVEGEPGPDRTDVATAGRRSLRWRGDESQVVEPGRLRPGDTIVVPASYGGADDYGWDPSRTEPEPVRDLGDRAHLAQRARPLLRLHPGVLRGWLGQNHRLLLDAPSLETLDDPDARDTVRGWLDRVAREEGIPEWARSACREMVSGGFRFFTSPSSLVLVGQRRVRSSRAAVAEVTTDDDTSCLTTRVTLGDHSRGVRDLARQYAGLCGVPPDLCDDVSLAGWLHDVGKADPRFQLWLHRGDRVAFEGSSELLAKSTMPPGDRAAVTRARDLSGYPAGGRHEVQSVALIERSAVLRTQARDWDLVVHLVASHHGRCRPLPPVVDDARPVGIRLTHHGHELAASSDHGLARLDSGMPDRFWRLVDRYGWYGLAYLELILRLADWRQSELEMQ